MVAGVENGKREEVGAVAAAVVDVAAGVVEKANVDGAIVAVAAVVEAVGNEKREADGAALIVAAVAVGVPPNEKPDVA